ncbi:O-antigen/teichoic acid export membrane protein [Muricomes intestini]|uniref:O-antigen/teichoic acid export membrane protein n=1 Tax=Muricomes intestini TaxID=1796634 RepID=A0A4R3K2G8_9FIRM|nr:flippase [Muricomes intestini]TCS76637.1 O-antigen/teichoic acid export membrane protein [Muricomes intestini]
MRIKSVKFNFIMNFFLTVSQFLFPLITFPYVSRVLKPAGTGSVAFATSVITYFTMFAMLGVPTYGIRACARVRENREELSKTVQELLIINVVMMLFCYVVFGVSLFSVDKFQENKMLLLISSTAMLLNVIGVSWLYSALEQYTYITTVAMVFKVISIALMFAFVHTKEDYIIYGGITVFANAGSYVLNFIRLRKFISLKPVGNYDFRRHIKPIFVFFAMSVATTIYTNLDTVMLGFMKTDTDVGYFNAAVKVKNILVSLVTSLGTVLLPRLSFYIENGQTKEFRRMIAKAINFVLLISFPLTIYFTFYARESILLLSGHEFMGAVIPMCVVTPTIIMIGLSNVLGIQVLVPIGKENKVLFSVIIGAVVDLLLNLVYIPKYAATGAAIGTLAAEVVVLMIQIAYLKQMLWGMKGEIHWKQIGFAVLISTVVIWLVRRYVMINSVFFTLVVSAIIYFGAYGAVLLAMKEPFVLDIVEPILRKIRKL